MAQTTTFEQPWPERDLQYLNACPVCGSAHHTLVHEGVKDWSFFSAPGEWTYWRCSDCESMYLNPRPSPSSIGQAYASYYTHQAVSSGLGWRRLKTRWKNERLSIRLARSIQPRLQLPQWLVPYAASKARRMELPFGWEELSGLVPGHLMDVGCGAGTTLALARQLGWSVHGLEMDEAAVAAARSDGLDVLSGGYERLGEFSEAFDAIVCSHVIEHVFNPVEMIELMWAALRPGGVLLLASPNAASDVHLHFGKHWRGLEAPRHLVLFTESTLAKLLVSAGFTVASRSDRVLETVRDSARIARQGLSIIAADREVARQLGQDLIRTPHGHDFIKLVAQKI